MNFIHEHNHYTFNIVFYSYIYLNIKNNYNYEYLLVIDLLHIIIKNFIKNREVISINLPIFNLISINCILAVFNNYLLFGHYKIYANNSNDIILLLLYNIKLLWSSINTIIVIILTIIIIILDFIDPKLSYNIFLLNYYSFTNLVFNIFSYLLTLINISMSIVKNLYHKIECPICYERIYYSLNLNCGHIYHTKCITKWLSIGNNTCPLCRKNII